MIHHFGWHQKALPSGLIIVATRTWEASKFIIGLPLPSSCRESLMHPKMQPKMKGKKGTCVCLEGCVREQLQHKPLSHTHKHTDLLALHPQLLPLTLLPYPRLIDHSLISRSSNIYHVHTSLKTWGKWTVTFERGQKEVRVATALMDGHGRKRVPGNSHSFTCGVESGCF